MKWRLIYSPALPGAWNMAIDEAMLIAHQAGLTIPTLRLYRWSPPAVSLGLLQPVEEIDKSVCNQFGFDIVRRPSGGGAVLHQHEVTYSVVMDGQICPEGSSVLATYRWLAQGLIAGLKKLGVNASFPEQAQKHSPAPFCFVRVSPADLTVLGRKLGGSAQARRRRFLLQHGSIPLQLDFDAVEKIFKVSEKEKFTCIEEALGQTVTPSEFADAIVQGFSETLGVNFEIVDLTESERQIAWLLFQYKYNTVGWTEERRTSPNLAEKFALVIEGIRH
ncbi:MAG: lipoate--protein ligase family protein [Candidatus Fervidibacter sp.]|uniref:lipoate--protein ligase family protein n=1 Tax=Candidatus Fervidibacter sp. TaxID=3100871 RepID=UPI004049267D